MFSYATIRCLRPEELVLAKGRDPPRRSVLVQDVSGKGVGRQFMKQTDRLTGGP